MDINDCRFHARTANALEKNKILDITIDSNFTVEQLEAITWWMRNKGVQSC